MTRQRIHEQIFYYGVPGLAFFLPLFPRILPVIIGLLVLNWLIGIRFATSLKRVFKERSLLFTLSLAAIYLLYLTGLINTLNFSYARFDLEVKLSLMIFPMVFATTDSKIFSVSGRKMIFRFFLSGCAAVMILMLGRAAWLYAGEGDPGIFYYSRMSWYFHPGYLSMYFVLALAILADASLLEEHSAGIRISLGVLMILFLVFIFLLSSKAGMILALLLIPAFVLIRMIRTRRILEGLGMIIAFALLTLLLSQTFPLVFNRLAVAGEVTANSNRSGEDTHESTASRLITWKTAGGVITENFWTGVGTGDVKDALMKKYQEKGNAYALKIRMNAHSQLLQTFAALGVAGFLVLIAGVLLPGFLALKKKDHVVIAFVVIVFFNMMVESILETQAGVIFFAFFNAFFVRSYYLRQKSEGADPCGPAPSEPEKIYR